MLKALQREALVHNRVRAREVTHYDGVGSFLELVVIHSCFAVSGVRTVAPNGFMNGTAEEDGNVEDSYPADGPLQSGTMSLRRVKPKSKVKEET